MTTPQPAAASTYRITRQRTAVSSLLDETEEFCTAQEIHASLRERGESVGLTTVYRTLQAMAEADEVDVLRTADGEAAYRRCGRSHHHHVVCRGCGRTEEVEGPAVERWAEQVAAAHGYTEITHTVEVFGRCPACTERG